MTEEKTITVQEALATDVPAQFVSERKGLSYVTGRYTKQRLNELFGPLGWSYEIVDNYQLSLDEEAVRWFAHVRLTVQVYGEDPVTVTKDGIAVGHGVLKSKGQPVSPSRASEVIDFAAAEAVTDALKRAAVSLGQNLGLSLYPLTAGGAPTTASRPAEKKAPPRKASKPAKPKAAPKPTGHSTADQATTDGDDW